MRRETVRMAGRPIIFEYLLNEQGPQADHALVAALANADVTTAQLIVETLLARSRPPGLSGLIAAFHGLDEQSRGLVLASTGRLSPMLREVSQSLSQQVRLNLIEIILVSRNHQTAWILAHLLHDRSASVRQAAGDALYRLAEQALDRCHDGPSGQELPPDEQEAIMSELMATGRNRRCLIDALETALTSFGIHHHPRIIEAAVWFVDDLAARLWPIITVAGSQANRLAIEALSRANDPRLVPFFISALHHSNLRTRALQTLAMCDDPAFWAEWFRQSWRLAQPRVSRGMAAAKELRCLQRRAADLLALPDDARRGAPRALGMSGVPMETRLEILKELERHSTDPATRRAAVWSLAGMADPRPAALLRIIGVAAAEPDPSEAAWIALLSLAIRHPSEYPPGALLARLNGPGDRKPEPSHPDGAAPATSDAARAPRPPGDRQEARPSRPAAAGPASAHQPAGEPNRMTSRPGTPDADSFERYWALFDQLDEQDRQRFGRQMLARTPPASAMLARQLSHPDAIVRLRALRIIRELDLAGALADQLYPLSQDPQPEVRSATITVLGELGTPASRRIIHNALDDPVPRVQANAIATLKQWGDESVTEALVPKLSSPDHRVQANAVKALLRLGVREAAETLLQMLQSDERARRISALWIIEQLKLTAMLPRLVAMAEREKDAQIKAKAAALVERLRSAGRQPPASVARVPPPAAQPAAVDPWSRGAFVPVVATGPPSAAPVPPIPTGPPSAAPVPPTAAEAGT
jgi:HEAT repeat protein